jgi:hypothetical protein
MRSLICAVAVLSSGIASAGVFLPCEAVTAEQSRVVGIATELAASAKIERHMLGCRVNRGDWPTLIFSTGFDVKGSFVFYFSAEIEDVASAPALKGLVAHELGHLMAPDHDDAFWRELTPEQRIDQEVACDAIAAALVGADAIRQAMDEYEELFQMMVRRSQGQMKAELDIRRRRLRDSRSK